jgi:hypothetical protein
MQDSADLRERLISVKGFVKEDVVIVYSKGFCDKLSSAYKFAISEAM